MRVGLIATICVGVLAFGGTVAAQAADGEDLYDLVVDTAEEGTPDEPAEPVGYWECDYHEVFVFGNNRSESNGVLTFHIDGQRWKYDSNSGTFWRWARKTCVWSLDSSLVTTAFEWELLTAPDPALGIDPAYDQAVKQVHAPVSDLNPAGPGYINLGMWLAIDEPEPVTARAETTNTWAEVTATLRETRFDMGNDDVVICSGAGDPIPPDAHDSVDESPVCGYTYREIAGTGEITITAIWDVTWVLSDGRSGTRDDIVLSAQVPYELREIQTVGVGG